MSDHLCSMNETLSKQREEIDILKMSSKVREGRGQALYNRIFNIFNIRYFIAKKKKDISLLCISGAKG